MQIAIQTRLQDHALDDTCLECGQLTRRDIFHNGRWRLVGGLEFLDGHNIARRVLLLATDVFKNGSLLFALANKEVDILKSKLKSFHESDHWI